MAGVGVPGPLHPYRGLGDVIQEAAHLVGDGPFVSTPWGCRSVARRWRSAPGLGGIPFEHRDNLGHDEHRLADVGVPGPLHPYRGLGDVVQEVAHLVGDDPFV